MGRQLGFLSFSNLEILNRGSGPTYSTPLAQTTVDLPLCSLELTGSVRDWHVSVEETLADHRHILFSLAGNSYTEDSRLGIMPTRYGSEAEIGTFANSSYEASCPLKKVDKGSKTPWWNSQIEFHRKKVRKLLNKAKRTKQPTHWKDYKSARREYKKSIRIAQRNTWKTYCQGINTLPEAECEP
ncbi:hypothetical protein JTB14_029422 [Gonioctena quinquepunctata]|nr:hypothetical protein JTB14_029422 [Gonioctena quinquepunctata]